MASSGAKKRKRDAVDDGAGKIALQAAGLARTQLGPVLGERVVSGQDACLSLKSGRHAQLASPRSSLRRTPLFNAIPCASLRRTRRRRTLRTNGCSWAARLPPSIFSPRRRSTEMRRDAGAYSIFDHWYSDGGLRSTRSSLSATMSPSTTSGQKLRPSARHHFTSCSGKSRR